MAKRAVVASRKRQGVSLANPADLIVQVQPRSPRSEVVGLHGDAVKVRLAAPPVDGAANDELVRFLAARLGVPRSAITLVRGATGRRKMLRVEGMTGNAARERLMSQVQS